MTKFCQQPLKSRSHLVAKTAEFSGQIDTFFVLNLADFTGAIAKTAEFNFRSTTKKAKFTMINRQSNLAEFIPPNLVEFDSRAMNSRLNSAKFTSAIDWRLNSAKFDLLKTHGRLNLTEFNSRRSPKLTKFTRFDSAKCAEFAKFTSRNMPRSLANSAKQTNAIARWPNSAQKLV